MERKWNLFNRISEINPIVINRQSVLSRGHDNGCIT
jgi:hypothetical protein